MSIKAKFQLQEVRSHYYNPTGRTLVFRPQYDPSIPEDLRFATATPSGEFTMYVDNPAAHNSTANRQAVLLRYYRSNPIRAA
jgi:hypothetical protein